MLSDIDAAVSVIAGRPVETWATAVLIHALPVGCVVQFNRVAAGIRQFVVRALGVLLSTITMISLKSSQKSWHQLWIELSSGSEISLDGGGKVERKMRLSGSSSKLLVWCSTSQMRCFADVLQFPTPPRDGHLRGD